MKNSFAFLRILGLLWMVGIQGLMASSLSCLAPMTSADENQAPGSASASSGDFSFPQREGPLKRVYFTDSLVIGTGMAGLAYTETQLYRDKNVVIVSKNDAIHTNTAQAQGGIAGALGEGDTPEKHELDTYVAGAGLYDERGIETVQRLVQNAPKMLSWLMGIGVQFDTKMGDLSLAREGGHGESRVARVKDYTGLSIEQGLLKKLRQDMRERPSKAEVFENMFIKELIVVEGKAYGAKAIDTRTGEEIVILAQKTLLATGGLSQIYWSTSNPGFATGDGIALAYKAGAEIERMEFVQFHPTTLVTDGKVAEGVDNDPHAPRNFLISEATRGSGALLLHPISKERFMSKLDGKYGGNRGELAPRDVVAREIFQVMKDSGANFVYLDLTKIANVKEKYPKIYANCLKYGFDITEAPIPVAPAAHFAMGGIKTDANGCTNIENLFAAGEVASNGIHGANRLASNSLLEGLVFGYFSGLKSSKEMGNKTTDQFKEEALSKDIGGVSQLMGEGDPIHIELNVSADVKERVEALRKQIQVLMDRKVGIVRTASELLEALEELKSIATELDPLPFFPYKAETDNILLCARLTTQAALDREESIGAHYREDFPQVVFPSIFWWHENRCLVPLKSSFSILVFLILVSIPGLVLSANPDRLAPLTNADFEPEKGSFQYHFDRLALLISWGRLQDDASLAEIHLKPIRDLFQAIALNHNKELLWEIAWQLREALNWPSMDSSSSRVSRGIAGFMVLKDFLKAGTSIYYREDREGGKHEINFFYKANPDSEEEEELSGEKGFVEEIFKHMVFYRKYEGRLAPMAKQAGDHFFKSLEKEVREQSNLLFDKTYTIKALKNKNVRSLNYLGELYYLTQIQDSPPEKVEGIKQEFLEHLMPLISWAISKYFHRLTKKIPEEDLFQSGVPGLHKGIEKFDPFYGTRMITYAGNWIRASIGLEYRTKEQPFKIPSRVWDDWVKWIRAKNQSEEDSGKAIADLGFSPEKIAKLEGYSRALQLFYYDARQPGEDGDDKRDFLEVHRTESEGGSEEEIDRTKTKHFLLLAIERTVARLISDKEFLRTYEDKEEMIRTILEERLLRQWDFIQEPLTLEGIGEIYHLSKERIRQIESRINEVFTESLSNVAVEKSPQRDWAQGQSSAIQEKVASAIQEILQNITLKWGDSDQRSNVVRIYMATLLSDYGLHHYDRSDASLKSKLRLTREEFAEIRMDLIGLFEAANAANNLTSMDLMRLQNRSGPPLYDKTELRKLIEQSLELQPVEEKVWKEKFFELLVFARKAHSKNSKKNVKILKGMVAEFQKMKVTFKGNYPGRIRLMVRNQGIELYGMDSHTPYRIYPALDEKGDLFILMIEKYHAGAVLLDPTNFLAAPDEALPSIQGIAHVEGSPVARLLEIGKRAFHNHAEKQNGLKQLAELSQRFKKLNLGGEWLPEEGARLQEIIPQLQNNENLIFEGNKTGFFSFFDGEQTMQFQHLKQNTAYRVYPVLTKEKRWVFLMIERNSKNALLYDFNMVVQTEANADRQRVNFNKVCHLAGNGIEALKSQVEEALEKQKKEKVWRDELVALIKLAQKIHQESRKQETGKLSDEELNALKMELQTQVADYQQGAHQYPGNKHGSLTLVSLPSHTFFIFTLLEKETPYLIHPLLTEEGKLLLLMITTDQKTAILYDPGGFVESDSNRPPNRYVKKFSGGNISEWVPQSLKILEATKKVQSYRQGLMELLILVKKVYQDGPPEAKEMEALRQKVLAYQGENHVFPGNKNGSVPFTIGGTRLKFAGLKPETAYRIDPLLAPNGELFVAFVEQNPGTGTGQKATLYNPYGYIHQGQALGEGEPLNAIAEEIEAGDSDALQRKVNASIRRQEEIEKLRKLSFLVRQMKNQASVSKKEREYLNALLHSFQVSRSIVEANPTGALTYQVEKNLVRLNTWKSEGRFQVIPLLTQKLDLHLILLELHSPEMSSGILRGLPFALGRFLGSKPGQKGRSDQVPGKPIEGKDLTDIVSQYAKILGPIIATEALVPGIHPELSYHAQVKDAA